MRNYFKFICETLKIVSGILREAKKEEQNAPSVSFEEAKSILNIE